jgi:hypothetical protein
LHSRFRIAPFGISFFGRIEKSKKKNFIADLSKQSKKHKPIIKLERSQGVEVLQGTASWPKPLKSRRITKAKIVPQQQFILYTWRTYSRYVLQIICFHSV